MPVKPSKQQQGTKDLTAQELYKIGYEMGSKDRNDKSIIPLMGKSNA